MWCVCEFLFVSLCVVYASHSLCGVCVSFSLSVCGVCESLSLCVSLSLCGVCRFNARRSMFVHVFTYVYCACVCNHTRVYMVHT